MRTFGDQGAIECINQAVLDQECFGKYGSQRAALAKDQQGCAESCERTRSEEEDRQLRHIGEKEHELFSPVSINQYPFRNMHWLVTDSCDTHAER